jgi:hypothetical protein
MRGSLFFIGALLALSASGCGDKTAAAGQVDPTLHSAKLDGGAEGGGPHATADAGPAIDDVAMPKASGEELDARMKHLVEAVAQGNADLAGDVVFPRDAYIQTKDSTDPQRAWEKKVQSSFKRSVDVLHKKTKAGEDGQAKFVSFELGHSVLQITPKKKDWKRPLWRVKHSKLTFTIDGKQRHLDIAEMTAWRGAWYVTKLRGT